MRYSAKLAVSVTTLILSFALILGTVAQAEAADSRGTKFARGTTNVLTGWLELFNNIWQVSKDENPVLGITLGTFKGVGMSLVRTASGLFDIFTFYMEPYDSPLIEPEYAWTESDL